MRKPAHKLSLALLNRQTHSLIIPRLYEHIVLHPDDYPDQQSSKDEYGVERGTLARLAATLAQNSNLHSVIRTLELGLQFIRTSERQGLNNILSSTNSLKRFRLLEGSYLGRTWIVLLALENSMATLESLDLSNSDFCYSALGDNPSLRHFIALKHLSIQSRFRTGILREFLPDCLQQLDVHCHYGSQSGWALIEEANRVVHLLVDLMEEGPRTPRSLKSVVMWLPWKGKYETSARDRVQKMVDQFNFCAADLSKQGVEIEAKVQFIRLDL